jgi:hypothetical protein
MESTNEQPILSKKQKAEILTVLSSQLLEMLPGDNVYSESCKEVLIGFYVVFLGSFIITQVENEQKSMGAAINEIEHFSVNLKHRFINMLYRSLEKVTEPEDSNE